MNIFNFELNLPNVQSRALKYGYSNARVKAMRGLILPPSIFDEMIKSGSVESMLDLLQRTAYKEDFISFSVQYKGSELIEIATSNHFINVVNKLKKIAPKSDQKFMRAMLAKYDALTVKFLLNAKANGKKYEEIKSMLFYFGSLNEAGCKLLFEQEISDFLPVLCKTDFGKSINLPAFTNVLKQQKIKTQPSDYSQIFAIQSVIDSAVLAYTHDSFSKGGYDIKRLYKIAKYEVDIKNIILISRLKQKDSQISEQNIKNLLIKGGSLHMPTIKALIDAKDMSTTLSILSKILPDFSIKNDSILTISDLEIVLEKNIALSKSRAFKRSILSPGVILGFLLIKEEELNNLRKIAKAKEFGLSEKETKELLVVI
ncbi:MAG: V-type ATPase subunit [Candidatus Micrarchaeota archaeon]